MKTIFCLLILMLGISMNAQTKEIKNDSIKNAVKEGILEAFKQLNTDAVKQAAKEIFADGYIIGNSIIKVKGKSSLPRLIKDEEIFEAAVKPKIIKREVVQQQYEITYYTNDTTDGSLFKKRMWEISRLKGLPNITAKELKQLKKLKRLSIEDSIREKYNATILKDPTQNFFIYKAPALPNKNISVLTFNRWNRPYVSAMTVPFKIREREGEIPAQAKADIKNLGLFVSWGGKWERLFYNNTTSTTKITGGVFIAPTVEELSLENTGQKVQNKTSKVFLSTAFAVSVTYNSITVALIPGGWDFGFNSTQRDWIYEGQHWWGFGLGIDTKLFGF